MIRKRLFFDIETSFNVGIFWRSGYNLNINPGDIIHERAIICICYKWEGQDEVHSLEWDSKQSDKAMLKKFLKVMAQATEIVAHNGDRFDMKWIRTRCLFHNLGMPPIHNTIDTLKEAKRYFNFNSNKLDYIAKFLGVGAKMDTGGLDLWKDIVFKKSPDAMAKMVAYCKMDVTVLESVFDKLNLYTQSKVNYAILTGGDKFDCPQCGTTNIRYNKKVTTSAGTIHHWLICNPCNKYFKVNNKTYEDWVKYRIIKKNIS